MAIAALMLSSVSAAMAVRRVASEPNADGLNDELDELLTAERHELGLTREEIAAWRPADKKPARAKKAAAKKPSPRRPEARAPDRAHGVPG